MANFFTEFILLNGHCFKSLSVRCIVPNHKRKFFLVYLCNNKKIKVRYSSFCEFCEDYDYLQSHLKFTLKE